LIILIGLTRLEHIKHFEGKVTSCAWFNVYWQRDQLANCPHSPHFVGSKRKKINMLMCLKNHIRALIVHYFLPNSNSHQISLSRTCET
jgi:hypothetical protein